MPQFFFDVHDGVECLDEAGTELQDAAAARKEAVVTAGEIMKFRGDPSDWSHQDWCMTVRNEARDLVLTLTLSAQVAAE